MLKDIIEARALENYRIYLKFEDGVEGEIDLSAFVQFAGVFEALKEPGQFAQLAIDPELGSIHWPSGADLDPDVLYSKLTGKPVPAN